MAEARTYNVPLRKGFLNKPRHKRAKRAVTVLREFLKRHMKAEDVRIGQHLNRYLWSRGMRNPPHHVSVTVFKEGGVAKAELEGHPYTEAVRPVEKEEEKTGLAAKLGEKIKGKKEEESAEKEEKPSEKEAETKRTVEAGEKEEKPAEKNALKDKA